MYFHFSLGPQTNVHIPTLGTHVQHEHLCFWHATALRLQRVRVLLLRDMDHKRINYETKPGSGAGGLFGLADHAK